MIWFVGLRGAIAFALSENMPGENKPSYIANTLCVCIFTTVVCGGVTERILTRYGMKREGGGEVELRHNSDPKIRLVDTELRRSHSISDRVQITFRDSFRRFDDDYLKPLFGGNSSDDFIDGEEVYDESEMKSWIKDHREGEDDKEEEEEGGREDRSGDTEERGVKGGIYAPPTTPGKNPRLSSGGGGGGQRL